jgi:uncharacterized membrane protein YidH (DUF202 family)
VVVINLLKSLVIIDHHSSRYPLCGILLSAVNMKKAKWSISNRKAALERTVLAYIRTAAAFSMQGVLVAQLFRIRETRKSRFNFYSVGIPLSVAFHSCAILIALVGAHRFWRQQGAIARGKIYAGGWELNVTSLLSAGVGSDIRCSSS